MPLHLLFFGDALSLHDLESGHWDELVSTAAEVVANGHDGRALVALASQPATGPRNEFVLAPLLDAARREVGMPQLGEARTEVRAAQGQVRKWKHGRLDDLELVKYVVRATGIETPAHQRLWAFFLGAMSESELEVRTIPGELLYELKASAEQVLRIADPWTAY